LSKLKIANLNFSRIRLAIFLLLVLAMLISLKYSNQIEAVINTGYSENNAFLDEGGLQVHFVNVGQGDGIVIEFPDNKTMIIDAGPSGNADSLIDYIDNNIFEDTTTPYFDYMVITHSDTDHIGAADEILDAYQVNTIYRPKIFATYNNLETATQDQRGVDTQTYHKVIERVLTEPNSNIIFNEEGLVITGGTGLDAYILTFYSPSADYYADVNDFSPIIVLQYRSRAIMLTGDATIEIEEEVVEEYDLPQIDVLKLGHHGSNTSTSSALLAEINTTYAIVSAGEDNNYGHPHQEVLNRLVYSGVKTRDIFITFEHGNILANVNTNGEINIFTEVASLPVYIEWKYIAGSLLIVAFSVCFVRAKPSRLK
jgi:competence protein ComEC